MNYVGSAITGETRYISADKPEGEFTFIKPRKEDYEYSVDVWHSTLFFDVRDK